MVRQPRRRRPRHGALTHRAEPCGAPWNGGLSLEALFPGAPMVPDHPSPVSAAAIDEDAAAAEMLRGHLECRGPSTVTELSLVTGLTQPSALRGLARLEQEGFAIRGRFTAPDGGEEFCSRRLLARIHAYTQQRLRREIEPVTARDFMRFLLRWQHVAPGTRREGRYGVLGVVEQLQGFELAAGAWEDAVLGARVEGYRREWLDDLCLSGEVTWGRLSVRGGEPGEAPGRDGTAERNGVTGNSGTAGSNGAGGNSGTGGRSGTTRRSGMTPSRATPITLTIRADLPWLLRAARGDRRPAEPGPGRTRDVLDALRDHGALFQPDLTTLTRRLPVEVEEALWDGVARGLVTADGFRAVRSLLRRRSLARAPERRRLRRGRGALAAGSGGRWSLLPDAVAPDDPDELAEAVAEQLAARWGVVFRDLVVRENLAVPWRDVLWAFRRMEARGTIRGGRFVAGFSGEQFALPEAVEGLRSVRKLERTGERVTLSAADPLNLAGIVLPGPRVPALPANSVTYVDGAAPPDDAQATPVAGVRPILSA